MPALARQVRRQRAYRLFQGDFRHFQKLEAEESGGLTVITEDLYPCLDDKTPATGFDRHYVYHTAWAARVLAETRPTEHVDIASSLYFAAMVSAFIPIRFYDFRPAELKLSGLSCDAADLTRLPFKDASIPSLSCMHVLEHIGLGRYGDPLDPRGAWKAMQELKRVVAGDLLMVVPVGRPRVCFNAHRVFSFEHVMRAMDGLTLHQFALIPDDPSQGGLVLNADPALVERQEYGCGCFWFKKR